MLLKRNSLAVLGLAALILILVFIGVSLMPKIDDDQMFGKTHYNDGSIGSVQTDTSDATLIIERNTGRKYLAITNTGSEEIYLWPKNYTGTTTASAEVDRQGGIYLGASGGSYEVFDNEFLWIGDVWVSTTTAAVTITYVEK